MILRTRHAAEHERKFMIGGVREGQRLRCVWAVSARGSALDVLRLTLGVLRGLAGLLQAVLLALLDPRIPGEETGLLQRRTLFAVEFAERPRHRETQCAGLASHATAAEV